MWFVLFPKSTGPGPPVPPDIPRIGATCVANRGYSKGQKRLPTGIFWTVVFGTLLRVPGHSKVRRSCPGVWDGY
jgi:hypothetical protein